MGFGEGVEFFFGVGDVVFVDFFVEGVEVVFCFVLYVVDCDFGVFVFGVYDFDVFFVLFFGEFGYGYVDDVVVVCWCCI